MTEMPENKPKMGDLVLVPFPFTDLASHKIRPALVVSSFLDDVTLLYITRKNKKMDHFVYIEAGPENGLKHDSSVVVSKISSLEKKVILGRLGVLNQVQTDSIKTALRGYLNL